jgi:hypothetical protein
VGASLNGNLRLFEAERGGGMGCPVGRSLGAGVVGGGQALLVGALAALGGGGGIEVLTGDRGRGGGTEGREGGGGGGAEAAAAYVWGRCGGTYAAGDCRQTVSKCCA